MMATKRRQAKDLSAVERKRIVQAWIWSALLTAKRSDEYTARSNYCFTAGLLLNVHTDTIRLGLQEERE